MSSIDSKQAQQTPRQLRWFGLIVGGIFAVIGVWPLLRGGPQPRLWALIAAGVLILPALVYPRSLARIYTIWMAIGHALGYVNTRIILTVLFYVVVTPLGFLMRFFSSDPMRRRFDSGAASYRIPRQPRQGSHMKHQF